MSEENIERLRRLYADWELGDFGGGRELFASDVVFAPGSPGDKPLHGIDNVVAHLREFLDQWRGFRVAPQDFSEVGRTGAGDQVVLVTERQSGIGSGSGVPAEQTFYAAWTFRDGLVVSVLWKPDREEALKAAGLSE
jgi:ketosteroid isomerase-like protein